MATLDLSHTELAELINLLVETAMEMNDDGRDGAFAASPLKPIYEKAKAAYRVAKAEAASERRFVR